MPMLTRVSAVAERRPNERGAALVTMLLISLLLLAAGGALIMTTSLASTNATDSISETQAYYAGEAGMQSVLNVLRGNVAAITFRQAVTSGNLAGWLTYNSTYSRVTLTNNYAPMSGMAYNVVSVVDPDNTGIAIFSVTGAFPTTTNSSPQKFDVTKAQITYSPPTNPTTVNSSGSAPFGSFLITQTNGSFNSYDISTTTLGYIPFNLTISQTAPYPSTSTTPTTVVLACKLTGIISTTAAQNTVQLNIVPPASNPTSTSNLIGGVNYARTTNTFAIPFNTATTIPATVTAPEPTRVKVTVTGYGPRFAEKHFQMLVSRFAFDFKANAAVTLRSADSSTGMSTFSIGNSSQYKYSGYDNAGGSAVPAFAVTNALDYTTASVTTSGNTQVTGSSQVSQVPISSLSQMLQTAQGARDVVDYLRETSQVTYDPQPPANADAATLATYDRYFPAGTTPPSFGTVDHPLTTFVDGDAVLPPAGGAGMLIVTGTLDMRGNADFKGLILVLGAGSVLRNGGGNGTTLGSIFVAHFDATGDFLAPSFDSNGGGTSDIFYDSKWVDKALATAGPSVRGVIEN